jgi:hypothetical protein
MGMVAIVSRSTGTLRKRRMPNKFMGTDEMG